MAIARPIRVLLVDDQTIIRQGLRSALGAYPNIEVVGEAGDGEEAVERAAKLQPTVVVMDISMPKRDGISATQLIKAQHAQIAVVGLSVNPKDYQVYAMQKAGAFEVLNKDQPVTDLYGAIQRAVAAVRPVLIPEQPISQKPSEESEQSDTPRDTPGSG